MKTLIEAIKESLFDVDNNIKNVGNVDFQDIQNAKTKEEFRTLCDILEENLKEKASTNPERIGVTISKHGDLRSIRVGRVGKGSYHMICWNEKYGLDLVKAKGHFGMEFELPKYLEKSFQKLEKTIQKTVTVGWGQKNKGWV